MSTSTQLMTAEELIRLPRGQYRYELVNGELITMSPAGHNHGRVTLRIASPLSLFVWDQKLGDWTDEWLQTNQLPTLVMVTLKLSDKPYSRTPTEEITRIISLPSVAVQPGWQRPAGLPIQQQQQQQQQQQIQGKP